MSEEKKQEATTPEAVTSEATTEAKASTDAPARAQAPAASAAEGHKTPAASAAEGHKTPAAPEAEEAKTPAAPAAEEAKTPAAPEAEGSKTPSKSSEAKPASSESSRGGYRNNRGGAGAGGDRRRQRNPRRPRRGGRRGDRQRQEFDSKIVSVRRVTRVMAGGRRFSFSVAMVIGDKKGRVGVGIGKASDTQLAKEKAMRDAKKHMITVPMNKDGHLPHDVHVKYASSEVMIMPAPGRGLVAGSSVRIVLELAGVKDVTAKIFSRSKNKLNNAKAAVEALKQLKA